MGWGDLEAGERTASLQREAFCGWHYTLSNWGAFLSKKLGGVDNPLGFGLGVLQPKVKEGTESKPQVSS